MIRRLIYLRDQVLRGEDIEDLMNGEALAIRVKGYYPASNCKEVADRLIASRLHGKYENAPAIGRVGQALFESQVSDHSRQRYYENAVAWIKELRQQCAPLRSPIDQLRLDLDEAWVPGVYVAHINGRKAFVGLIRDFGPGSEAEPHQDVLEWDVPDAPEVAQLKGQLAANIYTSLPDKGGALSLYDICLSREQYDKYRLPGSYGLRREMLPRPVAVLQPEQGELILFDARRVHAVERIEAGSRVTCSCFIGYGKLDEPLVIWS